MVARVAKKHHYRTVFFGGAFGENGPDSDGRGLGYVQAWHRRATECSPFCIPNELICAELAHFLQLPVPPFAITHAREFNSWFFSSLDFNFDRDELPPIDPESCCECLPDTCTGVILFDMLVANCDRHACNLVVDDVSRPRHMRVFDHDQALLGGCSSPKSGVSRLSAIYNHTGVTGGPAGGNRHCLIDYIATDHYFDKWIHRIGSMPKWLIEEVCDRATAYGLSKDASKQVAEFLLSRKDKIERLVKDNKAEFSSISEWNKGRLF